MSEIIDTGLGWWANEDWLKNTSVYLGEISETEIPSQFTRVPYYSGTDAAGIIRNGIKVYLKRDGGAWEEFYMTCDSPTPIYCANITPTGFMGDGGQIILAQGIENVYQSRHYATRKADNTYFSYSRAGTLTRHIGQFTYSYTTFSADYLDYAEYPGFVSDVECFDSLDDALQLIAPGTFYKLNSGYSISCFIRWINANQDELVAPILISTDQNAVVLSTDETTPSPGIVTGIEFGGMTFYINILLGYSGTVTANVPYQNLTSTFPDGINITDLFRAIVTLAQVRFSEPYAEGGYSDTAGGGGNFDNSSTPINVPNLPIISAVDAGFITLFNPTITELNALATYMWTNSLFDLNTWKKIFADPMNAILGLSIVPVDVPSSGVGTVSVGNISTGISMTKASSQYVTLDCGTVNVNEYWGGYLDYDPYTKAEIYLPYVGTHALSMDDIMGKAVNVVYHIDILSGACCAYIKCGDSVLYSFVGQCASSIPITGNDWTSVVNGAISIAASLGTMVATGGAAAPIAAGVATTAVNQMKPNIEKSGSMGGTGGMLGIQTPYLILTRPRQALPERQNEFIGYPAFVTVELGDISGYTEIETAHLENIPATKAEIREIENLLQNGVIF